VRESTQGEKEGICEVMNNQALIPGQSAGTVSAVQADSEVARAAAEVQSRIIVARQFPRDMTEVTSNIRTACQRQRLAELAIYQYRKGGAVVEGPSIRLAEMIAREMGNIQFGRRELSTNNRETKVQVFAYDLERNTSEVIEFTVRHEMKARGQRRVLEDPREIYEHVANQSARRMRAALLAVIPGDVVDMALDEINKTLSRQDGGKPLTDQIREMVFYFRDLGVTAEMIEGRVGHSIDSLSHYEVAQLRKIFASLRDEASSVSDWFEQSAPADSVKNAARDAVKKRMAEKKSATQAPAEEPPAADDKPKPKRKRASRKKATVKTPETAPESPPEPEPPEVPTDAPDADSEPAAVDLFGEPTAAGQENTEAYWVRQVSLCESVQTVDSMMAFAMEDEADDILSAVQLANVIDAANKRKAELS